MAIAGKIWPPVPPPLMMILKPFPIVFILFLLILYAYIDAAPGSCLSEGTDVFFSFRCKSNQNFAPYPPFSKKLSKDCPIIEDVETISVHPPFPIKIGPKSFFVLLPFVLLLCILERTHSIAYLSHTPTSPKRPYHENFADREPYILDI